MRRRSLLPLFFVILSFSFAGAAAHPAATKEKSKAPAAPPGHVVLTPEQIKWVDAPPSLPAGAKVAVLEGDPSKEGIFSMRLRVPDGYKIAPHWHPARERVTVISGIFHVGMGDKFDSTKGVALPAGSYTFMNRRMHHYAWFTGPSEIQLTGVGPWKLIYVNPADDPRGASKK